MNIESLIRPNIRALKPYHSARQDFLSGVLLDANENAYGSVVHKELELNRYPDPFQQQLRKKLAELNSVKPENIFIGVGSDEVIDLLVRIFCRPQQDSVLLLEPTYGMYRVAASVQDVEVRSCLLTEQFQIDIEKTISSVSESTKLIFCCSPNNPTANLLRPADIFTLCKLNVMVVVDEAYIDFASEPSLAKNILQQNNLIVMRTLSKAWGLAGIRLGYCVADPLIVSYALKVKAPYNINSLTSKMALEALSNVPYMQETLKIILRERERLTAELKELPCVQTVFPSDANFLLARFTDANTIYNKLVECGIIIRNRTTEPMLQNCLRITVGTPSENDQLINALKEICQ
ncbi:MAG TPA: histidinol-phosphate transaminase [Bacteroidota bacterium]|nr:histidinol-phosphate transaminase [Bacteroidota bacterium]